MTTSITSKVLFITLIAGCAGILFLSVPTPSHANETADTASSSAKVRKAKVDATCMQTAVDTREDAIISAWDAYATTMKTGLSTRKTALHDAWGLTDLKAQRTAIAAAWKAWKTTSVGAHKELKADRKGAWDAFKKTVKDSCKIATPKEEALGKDASGSISL